MLIKIKYNILIFYILIFYREYDLTEADLRECLGLHMAKNVIKSITISVRESSPPQHLALLFYPKRICFTDLYGGRGRLNDDGTTGIPTVGRARTLWGVDLSEITAIRASTHGVAIQ